MFVFVVTRWRGSTFLSGAGIAQGQEQGLQASPQDNCVVWGKLLNSRSLSFPHCKIPVRLKETVPATPLAQGPVVPVTVSSAQWPLLRASPLSSLPRGCSSNTPALGGPVARPAITLLCWGTEAMGGSESQGQITKPCGSKWGRGQRRWHLEVPRHPPPFGFGMTQVLVSIFSFLGTCLFAWLLSLLVFKSDNFPGLISLLGNWLPCLSVRRESSFSRYFTWTLTEGVLCSGWLECPMHVNKVEPRNCVANILYVLSDCFYCGKMYITQNLPF